MSSVDAEAGPAASGIQVIARAAAILRVLKNAGDGLSLGQIASHVGLPRSTVQRIVNALLAERLVAPAGPAGGYRLGPELQSLAMAGRTGVADLARPYLTELSRQTGETVDLAEFETDHLVFIDQIVGTQRLRAVATVGERFPVTTTANGKACLSLLDEGQAADIARRELDGGDTKGRTLQDFLTELEQVRARGVAYDLGEHTDGISAAGVSFEDSDGRIYAVSIPAPSHRFERNKAELKDGLLRTVEKIKTALG